MNTTQYRFKPGDKVFVAVRVLRHETSVCPHCEQIKYGGESRWVWEVDAREIRAVVVDEGGVSYALTDHFNSRVIDTGELWRAEDLHQLYQSQEEAQAVVDDLNRRGVSWEDYSFSHDLKSFPADAGLDSRVL